MSASKALLCLGLVVFCRTPCGHAQNMIEETRVFTSSSLAGRADMGSGTDFAPAAGVTVELCTPRWQSVLASTQADKNGHFAFERPKTGNLFYLRFHAVGVKWYQLRVRTKKHGAKELTIHLENAL